jgi:hypothetical protein
MPAASAGADAVRWLSAPGGASGASRDAGDRPPPAQVCIVSPSALARRFLMRHLCDLGYEVLESRDLDDPLLPADLRGIAALFLDESLQEEWSSRAAAARGDLPLVLLTVDGELRLPAVGDPAGREATLPRPFERSEVEQVAAWLQTLRGGGAGDPSGDDGLEQDDTWIFVDSGGSAGAGDDPRR